MSTFAERKFRTPSIPEDVRSEPIQVHVRHVVHKNLGSLEGRPSLGIGCATQWEDTELEVVSATGNDGHHWSRLESRRLPSSVSRRPVVEQSDVQVRWQRSSPGCDSGEYAFNITANTTSDLYYFLAVGLPTNVLGPARHRHPLLFAELRQDGGSYRKLWRPI